MVYEIATLCVSESECKGERDDTCKAITVFEGMNTLEWDEQYGNEIVERRVWIKILLKKDRCFIADKKKLKIGVSFPIKKMTPFNLLQNIIIILIHK